MSVQSAGNRLQLKMLYLDGKPPLDTARSTSSLIARMQYTEVMILTYHPRCPRGLR